MKVDFLDLSKQHQPIAEKLNAAIADVIHRSAFIKSEEVALFEERFAAYLGADHVVACANGTDAIEIALRAFNIGPGDEVLVPAVSWISTSEVVATAGAKPIFVDIESTTFCIDASKIEEKITARTKAIIPVHLYGHPADMQAILKIAGKNKLKVIEDCAQAHGAEINGKKVGTFGDAATFSFFPTKNLGAFGDAGAMVFHYLKMKIKASAIANHGQTERHNHTLHGRNSRMDGLQAAVLLVKLKYLDKWIQERRIIANWYYEELNPVKDIVLPSEKEWAAHAYHLYVIRSPKRDDLMNHLKENGISTLIHYPKALPFQPCYATENYQTDDFPVAAKVQEQILSLPFFPGLSRKEVQYVCDQIKNFHH
ncbi:MAG: DegT/DnrJ/EryC1/StrS family aminotransferase [Leeuwenhoekiella sp.]